MLWKGDQSLRVKKERKPTLRGKWESVFQWKAHGQCSRGDSCSFSHESQAPGNSGKGQRQTGRSSSLASQSKANKLTARDKNPHRDQAMNRRALWTRVKFHADGDKCYFRHVEVEGKPSKKSKKGGAKGSVAILKESFQLGCVSQDSYPRKSIYST